MLDGCLDGAEVPFDLAANAASWGADVLRCNRIEGFMSNWKTAVASSKTTVLHIETDLARAEPPGTPRIATTQPPRCPRLDSTQQAYAEYVTEQAAPRTHL